LFDNLSTIVPLQVHLSVRSHARPQILICQKQSQCFHKAVLVSDEKPDK
jgi:hypothetical protein